MRSAFIESLTVLAEEDESIMLLTGDLGFTVFEGFQARFPTRFINMGVAEQNMIAVAAGLALSGKRVFVYSIIPFVTLRCLEQIRNDLCFHHLPVCVVGIGSGYSYGHMGPSHHALEDIALLRSLPDMTVICPGDPLEAKAAVRAIGTLAGPCYLRLGKNGERAVHQDVSEFRIGQAIQVRDGTDVTLMTTGTTLETAVETAALLAAQNISARIVSMHTVKPLDANAVIRAAADTQLIVTIEEHRKTGGLGSAVAESLAESGYHIPQVFCAAPESMISHCASAALLREQAGLTAPQIAARIFSALAKQTASAPLR